MIPNKNIHLTIFPKCHTQTHLCVNQGIIQYATPAYLRVNQTVVQSFLLQELEVSSLIQDDTFRRNQDDVSTLDCGQTVGYHQGCTTLTGLGEKFNGTSTPKGSYRAKTGDNDCNVNSSPYSLSTALCESIRYQAKSEQHVRQDLIPRVRHGEAALCTPAKHGNNIMSS